MTLTDLPAIQDTTPGREARRALMASLMCFAGGALWVLAEMHFSPVSPVSGFQMPAVPIAPRAWGFDAGDWDGLAGFAVSLSSGVAWTLRIAGTLLLAAAALLVIHPAVFQRPALYVLPPFRRTVAWLTSLLIGLALPATLLMLTASLTPEGRPGEMAMDSGVTMRIGLGIAVFCAVLWALAGRGLIHPRALVRLAHGGIAGFGIFGALGIAAVATRPLIELAALSRDGNVFSAADAGAGSLGATFGWMLGATMLIYGLGCAVAGAVAVTGAPQSVGQYPRYGPAMVTMALLGLLMVAAGSVSLNAERRVNESAPDLVAELGLATSALPRPVLLLTGDPATRRVPPRAALAPADLASDCAPVRRDRERALPAATEENAAKLRAFRDRLGSEISGRAARALGCEVAIRARLFEPGEARRLIFSDPNRARVGYASFRAGVRGLLENVGPDFGGALVSQLSDTAGYVATRSIRERLATITAAAAPEPGIVTGRLAVSAPQLWRIGIVAAGDSGQELSARTTLPSTDGAVLAWMADAVSPADDGGFVFRGLRPGAYRLALLAPPGTEPAALGAMAMTGDPGRFVVRPGATHDVGIVALRR